MLQLPKKIISDAVNGPSEIITSATKERTAVL